jgi:hypothetical protein
MAKQSARVPRRHRDEASKATRLIALVALICGVLALTVGFAAIVRDLTVHGVAEIRGPEWEISFEPQSSLASGSAQITSTQLDAHTISYHVIFTAPAQSAALSFRVANDGTSNAEIAHIATTGASDYAAKHIDWALTYADGTPVAVTDGLAAGARHDLKLALDYTATQAEFAADAGSQVGMTITLQYAQVP